MFKLWQNYICQIKIYKNYLREPQLTFMIKLYTSYLFLQKGNDNRNWSL
jgi:hypothetical protein